MENYYNPDWWDEWVAKSLKKKARLLNKRVRHLNRESDNFARQKYFIILQTMLNKILS